MTFGGVPSRPAGPAAAGLAYVGPLLAFVTFYAATGASDPIAGLALALSPLVLAGVLLRPDLAVAGLAGLVAVNAGALSSDRYGLPNVETLVITVVALAMLTRPRWLSSLGLAPVVVAFVVFAGVRIASALAAPDGADVYATAKTLGLGGVLILVVAALGTSATWLRRAAATVAAAAASLTVFTSLKLSGIGDEWGGLAGDAVLSAEAQAIAIASLQAPTTDLERISGPIGDPNYWAQCQVLVLPIALWLLRDGRSPAARLLGGASSLLLVVGILQTESRGGALALLVAAAVWLWCQGGVLRRLLVVLPPLVLVLLAASGALGRFGALGEIATPDRASDPSLTGRTSEALVAVEIFRDYPLTGIGPGQYEANYAAYAPRVGLDDRLVRQPHNSYLGMAAESGAFGLAAFIGILATAIACALAAWRRLARRGLLADGRLAAAIGAGLSGYAVAAVLLDQAFPQFLFLGMGLAAAAYALATTGGRGAAPTRRPSW